MKSLAQLMNAIGHAGRPNIAARSAALIVPSEPIWINAGPTDIEDGLAQADVLSREDAAIELTSTLESLVAAALAGVVSPTGMSRDELTAFTYLPISEGIEPTAGAILARSYGVWRREPNQREQTAEVVAGSLGTIGAAFLEDADVPAWTAQVAYRSGLSLPEVFAVYRAVESRPDSPRETLGDWISLFGEVMSDMPPHLGRAEIQAERIPAGGKFSHLKGPYVSTRAWRSGWDALFSTLREYFDGAPLAEIARGAFAIEGDVPATRSDGTKPLPKIIGLLDRSAYGLSMVAGGLVALFASAEEADAGAPWETSESGRFALEMLPLAIRNGCGDRSSLSWYRFGVRHRRIAHLLASLMPLPEDLSRDEEVESWIVGQRNAWLDNLVDDGVPSQVPETAERALIAAAVIAAGIE